MYRQGLTTVDFTKALPYRISKMLIKKISLKRTDVILNHKMILDERDSLNLAWNRVYEPYETNVVSSIIKPNDIIVDVGANIGYYTLIFSKLTGKGGKVFAFEPSNSNFKILNENIRINKYSDVVVTINKAVSDKEEQMNLYLNDENHGMNRIFKSNAYAPKTNHVERIETIRLDSFFDKLQSLKVDFVKLDIEGSEYGAIKGMQKIIDNNKKLALMTEFHPSSITEYGIVPRQFLELLYSFGFNIWSLDRTTKKKRRIALSSKCEVDDLIKIADKQTTNLLCSR
jgi:FkbM family methyltransferase